MYEKLNKIYQNGGSKMGTDERNFRSIYYEKVGFKSVEEKKSLEMLLKEKSLDGGKLKQFCLRFAVPHSYRSLLWKLLLGNCFSMKIQLNKMFFLRRLTHASRLSSFCYGPTQARV